MVLERTDRDMISQVNPELLVALSRPRFITMPLVRDEDRYLHAETMDSLSVEKRFGAWPAAQVLHSVRLIIRIDFYSRLHA